MTSNTITTTYRHLSEKSMVNALLTALNNGAISATASHSGDNVYTVTVVRLTK